jgi:hypothetical protein
MRVLIEGIRLEWLAHCSNRCATRRGACSVRHVDFRQWQRRDRRSGRRAGALNGTIVLRVKLTAARAAFLHGGSDQLMESA